MSRRWTVWCAAAALAAGPAAAQEPAWRVAPRGPEAPLRVPLPPLARRVAADGSGETWRQAGELGGSVAVARGDVVRALSAAGWRLDKTIVLGRGASRSELMLWRRERRRILFKVWEIEAGTCGFAWGEDK